MGDGQDGSAVRSDRVGGTVAVRTDACTLDVWMPASTALYRVDRAGEAFGSEDHRAPAAARRRWRESVREEAARPC